MFCGNCGSQNPDGATNCAVCGAPLATGKPAKKPGFDLKSMDRNKLIGLGVIAAVVVVAIILILVLALSGRSAESTLEDYAKGVLTLDAEKIMKIIPKADIESYADKEDISNSEAKEEIMEDLQKKLDDLEDSYKKVDPEDVGKVTVEIRDKSKMTGKEVREFNDRYDEDKDVEIEIKEGMTVEIKLTVKFDGDEYKYRVPGIRIVKIGSSWYVTEDDVYSTYRSIYSGLNDELTK